MAEPRRHGEERKVDGGVDQPKFEHVTIEELFWEILNGLKHAMPSGNQKQEGIANPTEDIGFNSGMGACERDKRIQGEDEDGQRAILACKWV